MCERISEFRVFKKTKKYEGTGQSLVSTEKMSRIKGKVSQYQIPERKEGGRGRKREKLKKRQRKKTR